MDAKATDVDYKDVQGRLLDFHALRHTFITNSGASAKTTQELARHSPPTLTIGRYAHSDEDQKVAAINALPVVEPPDEMVIASGTDGENCPSYCPKLSDSQGP